jgi:hypothetical protein
MAAEAIHVPVAVRSAAIREKNRDLMKRLWRKRPEVPHHRGRLEVGLRVAFLGMNEITEFQWVANKEDRRVVAHHVPIALFGIELHRESTRVPFRICRTFLAALFSPWHNCQFWSYSKNRGLPLT